MTLKTLVEKLNELLNKNLGETHVLVQVEDYCYDLSNTIQTLQVNRGEIVESNGEECIIIGTDY